MFVRASKNLLLACATLVLLGASVTALATDFTAECTGGVLATYRNLPVVQYPSLALNIENDYSITTTVRSKEGHIIVTVTGPDFDVAQAGERWKQVILLNQPNHIVLSIERPGPNPSITIYRLDMAEAVGLLTTTQSTFSQQPADSTSLQVQRCRVSSSAKE